MSGSKIPAIKFAKDGIRANCQLVRLPLVIHNCRSFTKIVVPYVIFEICYDIFLDIGREAKKGIFAGNTLHGDGVGRYLGQKRREVNVRDQVRWS